MPSQKALEQKKQIVADLTEKLKSAASGLLIDYRGITVEEDTKLRNKLREAGVEYSVVKNTLTRFAVNQAGFEELDKFLSGPTSLAISKTDPIAPAKIICEFAKTNDKLEIKAGFVDGRVIGVDEIKALASIPSYEVLLTQLLYALNGNLRGLAIAIKAIADKAAEPAEAAAAE